MTLQFLIVKVSGDTETLLTSIMSVTLGVPFAFDHDEMVYISGKFIDNEI